MTKVDQTAYNLKCFLTHSEDKKNLHTGYKNRTGFHRDRNLFVNYRDKNQEWASTSLWELRVSRPVLM